MESHVLCWATVLSPVYPPGAALAELKEQILTSIQCSVSGIAA